MQWYNLEYTTDECQTRKTPYVTDECNTYSDQLSCWRTDVCERFDQKCFPGEYCSVWATCPAPTYGGGAYAGSADTSYVDVGQASPVAVPVLPAPAPVPYGGGSFGGGAIPPVPGVRVRRE